jgi:phage shock protein PspC (stress-responsive transcriptional regulator)
MTKSMKKAVKINISGMIFHLDEDAYELLLQYNVALAAHFGKGNEGKEICDDIERRIAELLQAKINPSKEVITLEDVNEVIGLLGRPEDFEEPGEESFEKHANTTSAKETSSTDSHKRLYRDTDNSVIAGVCSGMGAYFRIDPVIIRIIFILLLFAYGVTFLIYFILWLIVPPAETTAEKLEMRGEDVTVSNIEKTIRNEYEHVKGNIGKINQGGVIGKAFRTIFHTLFVLLRMIFKLFAALLGFILFIVGVALLIGVVSAFFFKTSIFINQPGSDFFIFIRHLPYFVSNGLSFPLIISLCLVVLLPLALLIYLGLKLMFKISVKNRTIFVTGFIIWITSVILFGILVAVEAQNFSYDEQKIEKVALAGEMNKPFVIRASNSFNDKQIEDYDVFKSDNSTILINGKEHKILGRPEISIQKSEDGLFQLQVERHAEGLNRRQASSLASTVVFHYSATDTALLVDPYFSLPENTKWRGPTVHIILLVPENTLLFFDPGMKELMHGIDNTDGIWEEDMCGKTWVMKKEGLTLLKK